MVNQEIAYKKIDKIINKIIDRMANWEYTVQRLSRESGVGSSTISAFLNHDHLPRIDTLFLLAEALNIDITAKKKKDF